MPTIRELSLSFHSGRDVGQFPGALGQDGAVLLDDAAAFEWGQSPGLDRYAHRMVIENTIADAIDFFHLDALSAAVPMKIDLNVQLTLMASAIYRILGHGLEIATPRTLFRKLVRASATIVINADAIVVRSDGAPTTPS